MSDQAAQYEQSQNLGSGSEPEKVDPNEIERLQAEVVELRQQVARAQAAEAVKGHGWRRFLVILLIVVGSLLAVLGNVALWGRAVVLNTNVWVRTVGPLSQNEVVANTISTYVVGEAFEAIDVDQYAREVLPDEVNFLSAPLTAALQDVVRDLATDLIKSDQFNAVWVGVNRTAHGIVMEVLRGGGDYAYLKDGRLTVDLREPFSFLQDTLGLNQLDLFAGEGWGEFVILESRQVAVVQQVLGLINTFGWALPFLALLVLFLAWLVSLWRRQTLLWIGVGLALAMLLLLGILALTQPVVLSLIMNPVLRSVLDEIWDVITIGLVWRTIFVLVVGVLIAVAVVLAGPHPRAVAIRSAARDRLRRQ
ncbi:MAG: hypothetical protein PVH11_02435 [Anaerolineae bacterium]|jgi:hypothetical protein